MARVHKKGEKASLEALDTDIFRGALASAIKPVRVEAQRILESLVSQLPTERALSSAQIDELARAIESVAETALLRLMRNDEYRNSLRRDFARGYIGEHSKKRSAERSGPFMQAVKALPDGSTEERIEWMQDQNLLSEDKDDAKFYRVAGSDTRSSIKGIGEKFSRLKQKLRIS